jgi:hypothetical protein
MQSSIRWDIQPAHHTHTVGFTFQVYHVPIGGLWVSFHDDDDAAAAAININLKTMCCDHNNLMESH